MELSKSLFVLLELSTGYKSINYIHYEKKTEYMPLKRPLKTGPCCRIKRQIYKLLKSLGKT